MICEKILPVGLNTTLVVVGTELVPCWSYRTETRDFHAFGLKLLVMKVAAFATLEDSECLLDEIHLLEIQQEDLELFSSQDEKFLLEHA